MAAMTPQSCNKITKQQKTPLQRHKLEEAYSRETYPSEASRLELAEQIGLNEKQVSMWFCHRRRKDKITDEEESKKVSSLRQAGGGHSGSHGIVQGQSTAGRLTEGEGYAEEFAMAVLATEKSDMELMKRKSSENYSDTDDTLSDDVPVDKSDSERKSSSLEGNSPSVSGAEETPHSTFVDFADSGAEEKAEEVSGGRGRGGGSGRGRFRSSMSRESDCDAGLLNEIDNEENRALESLGMAHLESDVGGVEACEAQLADLQEKRAALITAGGKQESVSKPAAVSAAKLKRREEAKAARLEAKMEAMALKQQQKQKQRAARIEERRRRKEALKLERRMVRSKLKTERMAAKAPFFSEKRTLRLDKEKAKVVQDEQLELMTASAMDPGLPQGLHPQKFPPGRILTNILQGHPLEEYPRLTGRVVSVWTFLVNFLDVLQLWPFTLKEFAAALTAPESRLLGEVHMALLRLLIRDIQAGQYDTEPGKLPILDGIATWELDAATWHSHLNELTWPEILRQYSLAAGWGPRLVLRDDGAGEEEDAVEDVAEQIASGAAADMAALQVLGHKARSSLGSLPSRLRPGTFKYAIYVALAAEGAQGLTVSEIVQKIKDSGLKDLSQCRNPEANVWGSCTKDALFGKVAMSRYCVRAAFRKDPSERESFLRSAVEAIDSHGRLGSREEEEEEEEEEEAMAAAEEGPGKKESHREEGSGEDLAGDAAMAEEGGESWVRLLSEKGYSSLTVVERVRVLELLVERVVESGTVRALLKERQESYLLLKQQIRAEAQKEKKRSKGESVGNLKLEGTLTAVGCALGAEQEEDMAGKGSNSELINTLRDVALRAEGMHSIRLRPLGQDRRWNTYWHLSPSSASVLDPTAAQIIVEMSGGKEWKMIDNEKSLDDLLDVLDVRGARELMLYSSLKSQESSLRGPMQAQTAAGKCSEASQPEHLFLEWLAWIKASNFLTAAFDKANGIPQDPICGVVKCKVKEIMDEIPLECCGSDTILLNKFLQEMIACKSLGQLSHILLQLDVWIKRCLSEEKGESLAEYPDYKTVPKTYAALSLWLSEVHSLLLHGVKNVDVEDHFTLQLDLSKMASLDGISSKVARKFQHKNRASLQPMMSGSPHSSSGGMDSANSTELNSQQLLNGSESMSERSRGLKGGIEGQTKEENTPEPSSGFKDFELPISDDDQEIFPLNQAAKRLRTKRR